MRPAARIGWKIGLAVVSLAAVVLLLMILAGVFHEKVDPTRPAAEPAGRRLGPADRTGTAFARRIPQAEWAVGTVRAVHETTLGARLLATVVRVHVEAGQDVEQDQVLVELDDRDLRTAVERSKAQVAAALAARQQAQTDYDRIAPLAADGSASAFELSTATNTLRGAEAEHQEALEAQRQAETILSHATIRAPVAGRIVDKRVDVGDIVIPGQRLVTMYDPKRMQLVATVRESLRERLRVGQQVAVKLAVLDYVCEATISEIVPQAESASRSFQVKVTGPCPPGVYPGMFGRLLIPLDPRQAVCVPASAVRRVGQLDLVDVVEGDAIRRRLVLPGRTVDDDQIEVLSGLAAGERVLINADQALSSEADRGN